MSPAAPRYGPTRPAWRDFLDVLWKAPLFALPFALFFLLTGNGKLVDFRGFYILSLIFSVASLTGVTISLHWLVPPILERYPDVPGRSIRIAAVNASVALLFGAIAAVGIHYTLLPNFLGDARGIVEVLTYFALFGALSIGITLAIRFHGEAMRRAGSERELLLARRIQQSFLPAEFPPRARLEVHAANLPSKEVSGDFYDVVPVEDGLLLAIADVSGKGVPAALLSSMLQASLRTQAAVDTPVAAMMARINALVCDRIVTGQFATFFLARVSERDLALRFTNAGHNFPIVFGRNGTRRTLETGGIVVGMLPDARYDEERVSLLPGDFVVLYTDGVTEAQRRDGEMLGEERLVALVEALPREASAAALVAGVLDGVRAFLGDAEAGDDITVMVLRALPVDARVVTGAAGAPAASARGEGAGVADVATVTVGGAREPAGSAAVMRGGPDA